MNVIKFKLLGFYSVSFFLTFEKALKSIFLRFLIRKILF